MRNILAVAALLLSSMAALVQPVSRAAADPYVAVVSWDENNRVTKYARFDSLSAAEAHAARFGGFAHADIGGVGASWIVDAANRTVGIEEPSLSGAALVAAVNAEADRRILASYPMSEQIWGSLRASQLIHRIAVLGQSPTASETATLAAIGAAMTFIDGVRTSRLALIATGSLTLGEIRNDASWPVNP